MSDQQEPVEGLEATPDVGTPEPESAPIVDYEKRYNDVRSVYDRTQNELHRYQNDPEFRAQLLRELAEEQGYQLDESGEPEYDPYADPNEPILKELQELKQWRSEFEQQQAAQHQAAIAESYSENKMTEFGIPDPTDRALPQDARELGELQRNWIVTRAFALPAIQDEQGNIVPDIEAAYAEFRRIVPAAPQATRPDAPFTPQGGQENTGVPALSENPIERRAQREAIMLEQLERLRSS